ncbi:hypothetical protein MKX03_012436 [Papaver bracteatum]|nr:hypothetical protein MKX03_012436 [Papaver bracteatum]
MDNHQVAAAVGGYNNTTQNGDVDVSRPYLGIPLGIALLLIMIFSLSGFFSCCHHREKIRSLRRSFSPDDDDHRQEQDTDIEADGTNARNRVQSLSSKPSQIYLYWKQNTNESVPVIMPGENIAKFIALPCPCEPFRPDKVVVEVQSMQQTPPLPPPPPQPQRTLVYNHIFRSGIHYNC